MGYHGDREARAQGSLQPAKGSCWELEENHVTVMRQQGPWGLGEFIMSPSPLNNPLSPILSYLQVT